MCRQTDLSEVIIAKKKKKKSQQDLIAVGILTGSENVQQVEVFVNMGHKNEILFYKKIKNNKKCPTFILSKSTKAFMFICVHLHCNSSCHLGQSVSFTMKQVLVCHLMETVGITVEQGE